ncbi:MAG: gamma-glutamylcyclotransferase family protein [Acidimicrobiia bacterium]
MPQTTLFFAYASLLNPDRINAVAPGSEFLFTAHYPETRMDFVRTDKGRVVPTLVPDPGHTVWGGVFRLPAREAEALIDAEKAEERVPGYREKAIDREGNKHDCLTFVAEGHFEGGQRPDPEYLRMMIEGARHWSLPAGWVLGLEDLAEDPLFS